MAFLELFNHVIQSLSKKVCPVSSSSSNKYFFRSVYSSFLILETVDKASSPQGTVIDKDPYLKAFSTFAVWSLLQRRTAMLFSQCYITSEGFKGVVSFQAKQAGASYFILQTSRGQRISRRFGGPPL